MAGSKTWFEEFLEKETAWSRTESFPVKASLTERLLTREAECKKLHPNPADEFCDPAIGPNYEIIADYEQQYRQALSHSQEYYEGEPLSVERLYPDGYRILNGHHRWAAAVRMGKKTIPIRIVNIMHEADVKKILEQSSHSRRAAIDLDEVILSTGDNGPQEKELAFPWDIRYELRLRSGVPVLFRFLMENSYDIWLYSAQYYSFDTLQEFFRKYHVEVTGLVCRKSRRSGEGSVGLERMIMEKYDYTVHIDNEAVVQIRPAQKEFREIELKADPDGWSRAVIEAVTTIEKESAKAEKP